MTKTKPTQTTPSKKTRVKSVSTDEQNPASTNVQKLIDSLAKRKERKKTGGQLERKR